ncbi:hypothetical protein NQ176_g11033 [Zarea fungicola]|uniref:Uncharacterized protein n=1 Tax=Zarea fungicola TaxID=93591 RepID=A0ACC1MDE0_9HYPO|nr:hypothetical protein NQ176_g11033 [Lecanicillium fungicola]
MKSTFIATFVSSYISLAVCNVDDVSVSAVVGRQNSGPQCEVDGWGKTTYYKSFSNVNLGACEERCLADDLCQSYSDDKRGKSGNCYLYKTAVKDTSYGPYTNWAMYDRQCAVNKRPTGKKLCEIPGWGRLTIYKTFSGENLGRCEERCLADPDCKSYSDDKRGTSGNCYLYKTAVQDTPYSDYTNWAMYDRQCAIDKRPSGDNLCAVSGWAD